MGDLLTNISLTKIPDIFRVASHAWGIEVQCLCLIPEIFSIVILFFGFIESVNILIFDNVKNKSIWFGVSFLLVVLIVLEFFWWGQMVNAFSGMFVNLKTPLLLFQTASFFVICLLLLKSFSSISKQTKINFLMMVIYGGGSFILFWRYGNDLLISEPILIIGESLLLVSFSYIAVFIHRELMHLMTKK